MIRACQGDTGAFGEIVERFEEPVILFLHRLLGDFEKARDTAQETFLKLWKSRSSYDPARSFKTWLYTIAKRTALDAMKKFSPAPDSGLVESVRSSDSDPSLDAVGSDMHLKLLGLMAALPPKQKTTFVLRVMKGFSVLEVAEIMECSKEAVLSNLFSARKNLRERIAEKYPEILPEGAQN